MRRFPDTRPVVDALAAYPLANADHKEVLARIAKELKTARVSNLLETNEYQLLAVDAPNVPQEELKTAIRWRLKDLLDFHVDDATVDVLDIPVDKTAAVRQHSMYAVAARNSVIQERQELFEAAGVVLSAIDIPDMAQRNISALLEPEGRGTAMLSFDAAGGLLTVTFRGELYLSRRIDVPLEQLDQVDADMRTACFDRIALELQRSLDHFDRQFHFITVAKLVIAPLGSAQGSLRDYLASNLYLPVEELDLASVFDLSKVSGLSDAAAQQRFFLALGAALREEEAVL